MSNLPPIISDLGLVMGAAAVVTLVFKRLKQPIVLGYILAGLFVGPYFPLFPSVADRESVETWAQIGVIILLFCLGLEFSFKKLLRVGGAASIMGLTEILVMLLIGTGIGRALGWSTADSIFLGTMVSISSTTIIIKAFDELGVKEKNFASLVFGVLVVQDLAAILMLVLLPTFAASTSLTGFQILFPVGKLAFFLVLWFVSGIFFLPTLLRKAGKFMNSEMLLITSLALCFIMVMLAVGAGFSPALGAFIMGSILAETPLVEKIEHLTKSIKEMFGAIFFVSVGMMIDPAIIPQYWKEILIISGVVLFCMPLTSIVGALLSRQPLRRSVQAGMSLSQIGEFSFIIATLGITLNLTSNWLYPVAVSVSALTTFTTPYMIKLSNPLYSWLNKKLPQKWILAINKYSIDGQKATPTTAWNRYITSYLVQTIVYTILIIRIILIVSNIGLPAFGTLKEQYWVRLLAALVTIIITAPFVWALAIKRILPAVAEELWQTKSYRGPLVVLQLLRVVVAMVIIGFIFHNILSFMWAIIMLVVALLVLFFNYKRLQSFTSWVESRFMTNLNEKEELEMHQAGSHLTPWDAHISKFTVAPSFRGIGMPLVDLKLREEFGLNIAMIKRGNFTIHAPDRMEKLYPEDALYVIGTDDQVTAFKKYLEFNSPIINKATITEDELMLQRVEVPESSPLVGKSIKESAIRERTKGIIVGVERNEQRFLNPESSWIIHSGDLLWIVGNTKRLKVFEKSLFKRTDSDAAAGLEINTSI